MSGPSPSSSSSKLSAFQVFSAVSKLSPQGGKKVSVEVNPKRKSSPKALMSEDLSRKPSSAPRSLITMVNEPEPKRQRAVVMGKRNFSNIIHAKEGKPKTDGSSVKSLMDLSFGNTSLRIDGQFHTGQDQQMMRVQSGLPIKRDHALVKLHSNSELGKAPKNPLIIRDSGISPSSKIKPLVVEMETVESRPTIGSFPKSLLDLSSMNSTKSRQMGLLDLPQSKQRSEVKSSPLLQVPGQMVSMQQLSSTSGKKKMEDEVARSSENEIYFGIKGPPIKKKRRTFELGPPSKKILTFPGKKCCFLVIPASCPWLHLNGKAQLCVGKGTVSIMAFTLKLDVTYDVYSPATGCLLAMHIDDTNKIPATDVKKEISHLCDPDANERLEKLGNDTIAVIKVKQLHSRVCDYVTSFIPFTQLFKLPKDSEKSDSTGVSLLNLGLIVAPHSEMPHTCMNWSPKYNEALDKWSTKVASMSQDTTGRGPILLICGGRNSGKSILNRCAVNVTLQSVDEVAYLDCDVGQTEFSPPGTLSLHIVKNPILGPPFCHQKQAERMVFFGDVNPAQDPGFYLRCLQFVFQAYSDVASRSCLPLIVNTMGFPEGVGLMLFIDTMNLVMPDLVIQLESTIQYSNFPTISREMVALDEGWISNKFPPEDADEKVAQTKEHELVFLSSLASPKRDFSLKLQPMDLRNLALLSSLSSGLEKGVTLMSLIPYAVPYNHLAIHVCHHRLSPSELLPALDASVVALCEADLSKATRDDEDLPWLFQEMPVCECVGLGIIRAVDPAKGVLLISTALPRVSLRKVNTILKGNLALPDHFFLNQKSTQPLPYVDALAPSTAVSAVRPRARMPRITLGKKD